MDGAEAARLLRANPYDVFISDISMPGNPDLAVLQELRGGRAPGAANAGIPVILMTGYPSAQTAISAINLSVLAYLVKPMEFQELLEQVRRGVAQRRIQQAVAGSARRIQDWAGEMGQLASGFQNAPGSVPVQSLLGAMLGRMGETLLDMKHLVDLSQGQDPGAAVCSVQHCPRLESYHQILQEGIEVLERTKGAFKSRHLEDLRHRMESAMEPAKN